MVKHIRCPICLSKKSIKVLDNFTASHAATHFCITGHNKFSKKRYLRLKNNISQLWNQDTCQVKECKECGAIFSDPFISGSKEFYNTAFSGGYPVERWEYDKTMSKIIKLKKYKNLKYLEIGSGKGVFIRKLLDEGIPVSNISSLEYSKASINIIQKMGVECRSSLSDLSGNKYDIILLFQVLEHIDYPRKLFRQLHKLSNNNAYIFISTPNIRSLKMKRRVGGLSDMPPNHVCQYGRKTFQQFSKLGWRLLENEEQIDKKSNIISNIISQQKIQRNIYKIIRMKSIKHMLYNKFTLPLIPEVRRRVGNAQWALMEKI